MEQGKTSKRYSAEERRRTVRMILEHGPGQASRQAAIGSIAAEMNCTEETLHEWVRQAERDQEQLEERRLLLEFERLKFKRQRASVKLLLKRRESNVAEKKTIDPLGNALVLAVVGGFVTLMTTSITSHFSTLDSIKAEGTKAREALQADLIKKFIDNPNPATVRSNLQFLVDIGLVPNYSDSLQSFLRKNPDSALPSSFTPFQSGLFNRGSLSAADFMGSHAAELTKIPLAVQHVVKAVALLQANMDSTTSYDGNFLSFGMWQWSVGPADLPGFLPALLAHLKEHYPADFERLFGQNGLDVVLTKPIYRSLSLGYIVLDGRRLDTAATKEVLRTSKWTGVFGNAGKDPVVDVAEMEFAADAVRFVCTEVVRNHNVSDWLTSELGIAMLVDEFVSRPGHVPQTLSTAIDVIVRETGRDNPAVWTVADEAKLLIAYHQATEKTSMMDVDRRNERLLMEVQQGRLSDARGSFSGVP